MKFLKHFVVPSLLMLALSGCGQEQPYSRTVFSMDTVMTLDAYGPEKEQAVDAAVDEISRLNQLLSVTDRNSEVYALNHSGGRPFPVSEDTLTLLHAARTIFEHSGGALDLTLYPVLTAWGFTTDTQQVPEPDVLQEAMSHVDGSAVITDEVNGTVTLPDGMLLDFGSVAKGYAGERCAQIMRENGITSGLMSLGGNVQTVGAKPNGDPWRVMIQHPNGISGDYVGVLELTDQAAVTSGGYQRYFESDGVRYWHILDPETGAPARSGLTSVTIVGDSGTQCDALSTALFVLGRDDALNYWRTWGGFEAILVDESNTVTITEGLQDTFTLNEETGYTLNIAEG